MKLDKLFNILTHGELAALKVGGKDEGGIFPKHSDEVSDYVRLALTALHSRFVLRHNEIIIDQHPDITLYKLTRDYAETNDASDIEFKYIRDSDFNPFLEDILYITHIYDEDGDSLPINVQSNDDSLYTPQFNVVQIPYPSAENSVAIVYRADHKPFDLTTTFPKDIDIDIPSALIVPLTLYVSYLAHAAIGNGEAMAISQAKQAEYELACLDLEMRGTIRQEEFESEIGDTGWV